MFYFFNKNRKRQKKKNSSPAATYVVINNNKIFFIFNIDEEYRHSTRINIKNCINNKKKQLSNLFSIISLLYTLVLLPKLATTIKTCPFGK
jgi:hypothetical protein